MQIHVIQMMYGRSMEIDRESYFFTDVQVKRRISKLSMKLMERKGINIKMKKKIKKY